MATFTLSASTLSVAQQGQNEFTVQLADAPSGSVSASVTSANDTLVSVTPTTLSFDDTNWSVPQRVTIIGGSGVATSGDVTANVTIARAAGSSASYASATPAVMTATVRQFGIRFANYAITAAEGSTFTINLIRTVNASSASFSPSWSTQYGIANFGVTYSFGIRDGESSGYLPGLHFSGSTSTRSRVLRVVQDNFVFPGPVTYELQFEYDGGDTRFIGATTGVLRITVPEADTAGITVSSSAVTVSENGGQATVTVSLTAQPVIDDVIVSVTSASSRVIVSPSELTFYGVRTNVVQPEQTFTVTGVDNASIQNEPVDTLVTVAYARGDSSYAAAAPATVVVTTADDDVAGIVLSSATLTVAEAASDTFTVALAAQPDASVVVSVASSSMGTASVAPAALTFSTTDWNVPQTVTVSGTDNAIAEQSRSATVTVQYSSGSAQYASVTPATVTVTITDNETPSITTSVDTLSVGEGSTGTFTAQLGVQPDGDVTLSVEAGSAVVSVSPASLTFTPLTWHVPQTVTVAGADNRAIDGSAPAVVTLAYASGSARYAAVPSAAVTVIRTDNDVAGITVSAALVAVSEAGSAGSFTVELTSQPDSTVVLSVSSADTAEVIVTSSSSLTFTTANWNVPQTVTVSGVNDGTVDGTVDTPVTVAYSSGSAQYVGVAQAVTVRVTNTNVRNIELLPVSQLGVPGIPVSVTVRLTARCTHVSVEVTLLTSVSLDFTNLNWDTPQTVTLPLPAESVGTLPLHARVVEVDPGDEAYLGVAVQADIVCRTPALVLSISDLAADLLVTSTSGELGVSLSDEPDDSVTVQLESDHAGLIMRRAVDMLPGSTATLTFTPSNWDTPQVVYVRNESDNMTIGTSATVTASVTAASADYANRTASVTARRIGTAEGFVLSSALVNVSGNVSAAFTVSLTVPPLLGASGSMTFAVTSQSSSRATVSPAFLTMTSYNWFQPQTVTVSGVPDASVGGGTAVNIRRAIELTDVYVNVAAEITVMTVAADPGIRVQPSQLALQEGGSGTLSVRLWAEPDQSDDIDVTLSLASSDADLLAVTPSSMTFTAANWNTPQTASVSTAANNTVVGPHTEAVTVSYSAGRLGQYGNVSPVSVPVIILEDDTAGLALDTTARMVPGGLVITIPVNLTAEPTAPVTVTVTSTDPAVALLSATELTFEPGAWASPMDLYIGSIGAPGQTTMLTFQTSSNDAAFAGLLYTLDFMTGSATFEPSPGGPFALSENGGSGSFTVVLGAPPTSSLTASVTSSSADLQVSPSALVFTPANWNEPQTLQLSAVDNANVTSNASATVTVARVSGGGAAFNAMPSAAVTVTLDSDDLAGITTNPSSALSVAEDGTATFTVVLTGRPASNVRLAVTSSSTGTVTVSPALLVFQPSGWNVPQTVTVSGVNNSQAGGNASANVVVALASGSSSDYANVASRTIAVTRVEDDVPGLVISASTLAPQLRRSATFTFALRVAPRSTITVAVASSDKRLLTVSPSSKSISTSRWNRANTVTVRPTSRMRAGDSVTVTVRITRADSLYANVQPRTVTVTARRSIRAPAAVTSLITSSRVRNLRR